MHPPLRHDPGMIVMKKNVFGPGLLTAHCLVHRSVVLAAIGEFSDIPWAVQRAFKYFHASGSLPLRQLH